MYKTRFEWKVERLRKKITIKEIADYINCSPALISKHENNDRNMSRDKLDAYKEYITETEEKV